MRVSINDVLLRRVATMFYSKADRNENQQNQLVGLAKRRAFKIRPNAVGGGILDRFFELP